MPQIDTVQTALDVYLEGDIVERDEPCARCGIGHGKYRQRRVAGRLPRVIQFCLKRWEFKLLPDSQVRQRRVDHAVEASDPLLYGGATYRLRSTLIHLGASPHSGHYIAAARHEPAGGAWWVNNDIDRRTASVEQVKGTGAYRCGRTLKVYMLSYKRD